MHPPKLGISIGDYFRVSPEETVDPIAEAGFDAISPVWTWDEQLQKIITAARVRGLYVQSVHAPSQQSANIWSTDPNLAKPALAEFQTILHRCADLDVPTVVIHPWRGFDCTAWNREAGLANISLLGDEAAKLGIRIAFENIQCEQILYALIAFFRDNPHIGFCWDSGHENCYCRDRSLLTDLGDRLIMTHLNDNPGISASDGTITSLDDLHFLPFDGTVHWEEKIRQLQAARRQEILNFEVKQFSKPNQIQNEAYARWTLSEYLAQAYQRACKIADMYTKRRNDL